MKIRNEIKHGGGNNSAEKYETLTEHIGQAHNDEVLVYAKMRNDRFATTRLSHRFVLFPVATQTTFVIYLKNRIMCFQWNILLELDYVYWQYQILRIKNDFWFWLIYFDWNK